MLLLAYDSVFEALLVLCLLMETGFGNRFSLLGHKVLVICRLMVYDSRQV